MRAKKASVLLALFMMTSFMYGQKNMIEDDLYFQPEDRAVVEKKKKPKTKTVYISHEEFENKYSTADDRNIDEYNRRGQSQEEESNNTPVFGSESAEDNVKYVIVDEDPSQTSINLYVNPWSVSWSSFSIGFNSMFWWSPYYYSSWYPNYPPYNYGWGWYDPYYSWGWNGCYPGYHYGWHNNWYNPWWNNHHHGGGYYPPHYGWNDHYYRPSYGGRTYSRNGNRTGSGYYNNDRYASSVGGGGSLGGASRYPDRNANSGKFNPGSRFPNSSNSGNVSATTRPDNNGQSSSIGSTRTSRTRVSSSGNTQISAGSSNKSAVVTTPSRTNNRGNSSQHVINSTGRTRSSSSSSASSSRSSSSSSSIFNSSSSSNNSSYSSGSSGRSSYSSGSSSSGSYSGGRSSGGSSSGGGASRGSRSR